MTTVTFASDASATTWLEHVSKHEDSKNLNSIHNSVVDLFKVTTTNEVTEDQSTKMLQDIMALKVNALLCRSPMDNEMMLIHQVSKVGGDLLNPRVEYFGLSGFGESAVPVKFCPKSILAINEIESPSWATLKAVTTPAGLEAAKDANPEPKIYTSAIPLPPFLTKVTAPHRAPSAGDIYFLCLEAGEKYDAEKEASDPPASATLKLLLPYLLAANLDDIASVPTSAQVSQKIELKNIELHKTFISQPKLITQATTSTTDLTLTPPLLEQMNAKLAQLVSNGIMADSAKSLQSKRKFETRLNSMFKTLIITASKHSDDDGVTEPTTTSREFFEMKNPSEAKAYLYHALNLKLNLPIYIPAGLATAIHTGVLFWERQDTPSNFSFFLVPPQSSNMMSDTADSIALSLKSSDGRGGIDSDDIRRLTKQKIFIPTSINELEHHLNHGLHILNLILGNLSFIVIQITGCLKHIKEHQAIYCEMLRSDNLFAARVLYIIDIRTQKNFRSAQQGIFNTAPLDFSTMFENIAQNRTFKASLPSCITNDRQKRKHDDLNEKGPSRNGDVWKKNPTVNPEWKL